MVADPDVGGWRQNLLEELGRWGCHCEGFGLVWNVLEIVGGSVFLWFLHVFL